MNILVNRHHADLHWSLELLAKRLGATLYIPKGIEWFEKGYFLMHQNPQKREPLRYMAQRFLEDDIWEGKSLHKRRGCVDYPKLNTLTFDEFLNTDIDIIIATNKENEEPMSRLRQYKPNARLVRQVGNRSDISKYPNTMYSDKESYEMNTGNKILYHQEFDLKLFPYMQPINAKNIYAFQHRLENYEPAEELWIEHQHLFPDYNFQSFGKENDGGYIYPKRDYVKKMQEATFVWQVKDWEGYSHVIHNSLALGRPMILRREDVKGRIFEPLCNEDTVIFTDQIDRLKTADYQQMSFNAKRRFEEVINFDKEYNEKLKPFFENLI